MKTQQSQQQAEIQHDKKAISDVFEFNDEVRGFDVRDLLDPLEQLEIYKDFLGEEEFQRVHANYEKTIQTMDLVFETEIERIKLQDTLTDELSLRNLN